MKYFVKVKFFPVPQLTQSPDTQPVVPAPLKCRFPTRDQAFEFAAKHLEMGAASVTIRPEL